MLQSNAHPATYCSSTRSTRLVRKQHAVYFYRSVPQRVDKGQQRRPHLRDWQSPCGRQPEPAEVPVRNIHHLLCSPPSACSYQAWTASAAIACLAAPSTLSHLLAVRATHRIVVIATRVYCYHYYHHHCLTTSMPSNNIAMLLLLVSTLSLILVMVSFLSGN